MGVVVKWGAWIVLAAVFASVGCARPRIVTVTFPVDGNSEYWVCSPRATDCHGKQQGEVDSRHYKPKMDSLAPPQECENGVARMEIVTQGNRVLRIGYECAKPATRTTGLGEDEKASPGDAPGTPDAPSDSAVPPDASGDEPTGLPD